MIKIFPDNKVLVLNYVADTGPSYWVIEKLKEDGEIRFKKTFSFVKGDLLDDRHLDLVDDEDSSSFGNDDEPFNLDDEGVTFRLGTLVEDYFEIDKGKITDNNKVYLHKSVRFDIKLFVSQRNISVFSKMEHFIKSDIYIGGNNINAIPESVMWDLIKKFPNSHQKNLYEASVITSIIRDYVDSIPDYQAKYEKYLNKGGSVKPSNLGPLLREQELHKFKLILDKLEFMLKEGKCNSEHQWQEEILMIIKLLYPKYVHAFKNVQLKRKDQTDLFIDILLVDSGGYVDIIEIKKPFENVIITKGTYRDNHVPYRELTGTIMQIEKYIYHLNRWGADGEKFLSQKLPELPSEFEVKLTNPGGLVIMGRDHNLNKDQKRDFEVVKRKYKNIMDILTYDELIRRLKFMIELWENEMSIGKPDCSKGSIQ